MRFKYEVEVNVERVQGKFASRDEIGDAIEEALNDVEGNISLDGLGADGESEYEITDFSAQEVK